MQKQLKKKFNINYITIILAIFCLFSFLPITAISSTKAEETIYSNVLDDLQKDENFNVEDYPLKENDYSLQVIQIAESLDKELFIYVYQPSGEKEDLRAKFLNMSLKSSIEDTSIYNLSFINSNGVFYKYKVEDVIVTNEEYRYYNITSIYRQFIEGIDKASDYEDQTITYKSYPVAKLWVAKTDNKNVTYYCYDKEVIEIIDKYTGFVRYYGGFYLFLNNDCDSHFVAFKTDRNIDKLLSARVYYRTQSFSLNAVQSPSIGGGLTEYVSYGEIYPQDITLKYDDKKDFTGNGLFAPTYTWDRIQTISDFYESVEGEEIFDYSLFNVSVENSISKENKKKLQNMDYVLRFAETKYERNNLSLGGYQIKKTIVSDVSILELTFETAGVVYSLGVVDNMLSGPDNPFNTTEVKLNVPWWLKLIFLLILLCVLCAFFPIIFTVLCKILEWLIKGIWFILKWIFKGIWYIITAPFSIVKKE